MARRRETMFGLDVMPLDYCEGCRRTHDLTRNSMCPWCVNGVVAERRRAFPRSEGNVFMRGFGRAFSNYFRLNRGETT